MVVFLHVPQYVVVINDDVVVVAIVVIIDDNVVDDDDDDDNGGVFLHVSHCKCIRYVIKWVESQNFKNHSQRDTIVFLVISL